MDGSDYVKMLAENVFNHVLRKIEAASQRGEWSMKVHKLRRDHAIQLLEKGMRVHPHPYDDHDYEDFIEYEVFWEVEDV